MLNADLFEFLRGINPLSEMQILMGVVIGPESALRPAE
jgi:hypothetical protein